jgi:acylphosphatase
MSEKLPLSERSCQLEPESQVVACKVLFSGSVQGVGFRFTTRRLAAGFAISGYVKNLMNGKVEVWAEGPKSELDAFIAAIERSFSGYISHVDKTPATPTGKYETFDIAF